jgi:hypothetical protein
LDNFFAEGLKHTNSPCSKMLMPMHYLSLTYLSPGIEFV